MLKEETADLPWSGPLALSLKPFELLLRRVSRARLLEGQLQLRLGARGYRISGARSGGSAELRIRRPHRLLWRAITGGDVGFGRAYVVGDWDSPDLRELLYLLARNEAAFARLEEGSWLHRILNRRRHRERENSRIGSRSNIAYHYDLGNAFYRLWLDESMTYSCAIFDQDSETLEQAQENKYRRLLGLLGAQRGSHVLEIGCGWGGFARIAAESGLEVTAITLSQAQLEWAQKIVRERGLAQQIHLRLQDYRELDGQFDHIVSIEMFEAVGQEYWGQYMQTLRRCLRPGGRVALQVITIDEPTFAVYSRRPDFVQRYIFPGGMLPTPERFTRAAAANGLKITALSSFGRHYARTLEAWHRRFVESLDAVRALGFDERFLRMWRYYLAYCEAGFRDGQIDLLQVRLEHAAA